MLGAGRHSPLVKVAAVRPLVKRFLFIERALFDRKIRRFLEQKIFSWFRPENRQVSKQLFTKINFYFERSSPRNSSIVENISFTFPAKNVQ
jgi:hypothetical protein